ncbi:hypothetical protein LguiA_033877 [Lonicera macranthoides]
MAAILGVATIISLFIFLFAGGAFSDNIVPYDSQISPASSPATTAVCNPPDSGFSSKEESLAVENLHDSSSLGKNEPNQNMGVSSQKSAIKPSDDPNAPSFISGCMGPIPPP